MNLIRTLYIKIKEYGEHWMKENILEVEEGRNSYFDEWNLNKELYYMVFKFL